MRTGSGVGMYFVVRMWQSRVCCWKRGYICSTWYRSRLQSTVTRLMTLTFRNVFVKNWDRQGEVDRMLIFCDYRSFNAGSSTI